MSRYNGWNNNSHKLDGIGGNKPSLNSNNNTMKQQQTPTPQGEILPGEQCGAFRFMVEGVIFHGIIENAREEYEKLKPSKKWYIWLCDNYNVINDDHHHTDAFLWGTKFSKDKKIDFALLSTIVNRMAKFPPPTIYRENKGLHESMKVYADEVDRLSAENKKIMHVLAECRQWYENNAPKIAPDTPICFSKAKFLLNRK